mmetsp:Transcript_29872/g.76055  ORF Transcript_29872/g.76055 Transcript_29872/m.76055 type:complete len:1075 (-) Transcript_29872:12-3236(-)
MNNEENVKILLDSGDWPFGAQFMIWNRPYLAWYRCKVIDYNKQSKTVKITYPGWFSDCDEWIPINSDRFDYEVGGREKWKPVKNAQGAFLRLLPTWTPQCKARTPSNMLDLDACLKKMTQQAAEAAQSGGPASADKGRAKAPSRATSTSRGREAGPTPAASTAAAPMALPRVPTDFGALPSPAAAAAAASELLQLRQGPEGKGSGKVSAAGRQAAAAASKSQAVKQEPSVSDLLHGLPDLPLDSLPASRPATGNAQPVAADKQGAAPASSKEAAPAPSAAALADAGTSQQKEAAEAGPPRDAAAADHAAGCAASGQQQPLDRPAPSQQAQADVVMQDAQEQPGADAEPGPGSGAHHEGQHAEPTQPGAELARQDADAHSKPAAQPSASQVSGMNSKGSTVAARKRKADEEGAADGAAQPQPQPPAVQPGSEAPAPASAPAASIGEVAATVGAGAAVRELTPAASERQHPAPAASPGVGQATEVATAADKAIAAAASTQQAGAQDAAAPQADGHLPAAMGKPQRESDAGEAQESMAKKPRLGADESGTETEHLRKVISSLQQEVDSLRQQQAEQQGLKQAKGSQPAAVKQDSASQQPAHSHSQHRNHSSHPSSPRPRKAGDADLVTALAHALSLCAAQQAGMLSAVASLQAVGREVQGVSGEGGGPESAEVRKLQHLADKAAEDQVRLLSISNVDTLKASLGSLAHRAPAVDKALAAAAASLCTAANKHGVQLALAEADACVLLPSKAKEHVWTHVLQQDSFVELPAGTVLALPGTHGSGLTLLADIHGRVAFTAVSGSSASMPAPAATPPIVMLHPAPSQADQGGSRAVGASTGGYTGRPSGQAAAGGTAAAPGSAPLQQQPSTSSRDVPLAATPGPTVTINLVQQGQPAAAGQATSAQQVHGPRRSVGNGPVLINPSDPHQQVIMTSVQPFNNQLLQVQQLPMQQAGAQPTIIPLYQQMPQQLQQQQQGGGGSAGNNNNGGAGAGGSNAAALAANLGALLSGASLGGLAGGDGAALGAAAASADLMARAGSFDAILSELPRSLSDIGGGDHHHAHHHPLSMGAVGGPAGHPAS